MTTTITGATGVNQITDDAITAAKLPAGSVLQVVSTTYATNTQTTSTTKIPVGSACSITPSATTSKILVSISGVVRWGNHDGGYVSIFKDVAGAGYVELETFSRHTNYQNHSTGGYNQGQHITLTYLDSPNTTNVVNYKMGISSWSGTAAWLPNNSNGDRCVIILQEIAG